MASLREMNATCNVQCSAVHDAATHRACSVGLQTMAKDLYTGLTFKDPDGLATSRGPLHKGLMCFAALELQCSFIYMASACAECALPMNVFGHSTKGISWGGMYTVGRMKA